MLRHVPSILVLLSWLVGAEIALDSTLNPELLKVLQGMSPAGAPPVSMNSTEKFSVLQAGHVNAPAHTAKTAAVLEKKATLATKQSKAIAAEAKRVAATLAAAVKNATDTSVAAMKKAFTDPSPFFSTPVLNASKTSNIAGPKLRSSLEGQDRSNRSHSMLALLQEEGSGVSSAGAITVAREAVLAASKAASTLPQAQLADRQGSDWTVVNSVSSKLGAPSFEPFAAAVTSPDNEDAAAPLPGAAARLAAKAQAEGKISLLQGKPSEGDEGEAEVKPSCEADCSGHGTCCGA